jgi:5-aminolevulinate synthase
MFFPSPSPSHIVPILIGEAQLAKAASDKLLSKHNIYVQSINFPTVAVGEERLRITVTPRHTVEQIEHLVRAVDATFNELDIKRLSAWKAIGGRAGVGMPGNNTEHQPLWSDGQIGLKRGTQPQIMRTGDEAIINHNAVVTARARFDRLLGPLHVEGTNLRTMQDALVNNSFKMATGGVGKKKVGIPAAMIASVA